MIFRNKIRRASVVQGMIGSGMCFVGMSWCVKKRGPVFTAAFSPLVQIMAALYDVPVMHEQLHLGRCPKSSLKLTCSFTYFYGVVLKIVFLLAKIV